MAEAGRVIAGTAAGRRLLAPGPGTRPIADRVKQTLFAILEPDVPAAAVLDLFAGSGAAGIEALSRGADRVVFVERDSDAVRIIQENLRRCGFGAPVARVVRADVLRYIARQAQGDGPFRIVIADPPYGDPDLLLATLEALGSGAASSFLEPNARVVGKHFWRDRPPDVVGLLASERERRFGETALTFYRRREAEDSS